MDIQGLTASTMEILLDFVYTETVHVTVENVQELLPAACLLQLKGNAECWAGCRCLWFEVCCSSHGCDASALCSARALEPFTLCQTSPLLCALLSV